VPDGQQTTPAAEAAADEVAAIPLERVTTTESPEIELEQPTTGSDAVDTTELTSAETTGEAGAEPTAPDEVFDDIDGEIGEEPDRTNERPNTGGPA
jgi:hypothetical protein